MADVWTEHVSNEEEKLLLIRIRKTQFLKHVRKEGLENLALTRHIESKGGIYKQIAITKST